MSRWEGGEGFPPNDNFVKALSDVVFTALSEQWLVSKAPKTVLLAMMLSTSAFFLNKTRIKLSATASSATGELASHFALAIGKTGGGKSKAVKLYCDGESQRGTPDLKGTANSANHSTTALASSRSKSRGSRAAPIWRAGWP
jgi:hypothetical protein